MADSEASVRYDTGRDDMWSFASKRVKSKDNPRWLWYLPERRSGAIAAYHPGRRADESLRALLARASRLPARIRHTDGTDDRGACRRCLPLSGCQHVAGKDNARTIGGK